MEITIEMFREIMFAQGAIGGFFGSIMGNAVILLIALVFAQYVGHKQEQKELNKQES